MKISNKRKQKENMYTRKNTRKLKELIHGEIIYKKEGWKYINIYGNPYQRGFAHGYLLFKEIKEIMKILPFLVKKDFKISLEKYLNICNQIIKPKIMNKYPEFYEELQGITEGCISKGLKINIEFLIGWNSFVSMFSYFENNKYLKCSAFIATGDATENGDIVMAHNTHSDFLSGNVLNIVLYITPDKGYPFVMQTSAGLIASSSDFFICSTGMIGCETTISSINFKPEFGSPYFCRIRQAMQYGTSIDDYLRIMLEDNAGDYACSWQFGDIKTNEISLLEIGLKEHSVRRTINGVYYGMNSVIDPIIYNNETTDNNKFDIQYSSGARNFRLNQLLNETYYGKINIINAKKILSDHYDVFLHKEEMNSRSICKHSEYDEKNYSKKKYPFGCTDGKVVNSTLAKKMQFMGRFGSSCGRIFKAKEYIKKNPQYKDMKDLLHDFPKYDWVLLGNIN